MWLLYVHINKINNKKYYGITSQKANQRWREEGKGYTKDEHQKVFKSAIEKYGWENFEHKIIADELTLEEASDCEQYYIARDKTNVSRWHDEAKGYNMTDGGEGTIGIKRSEETRKKLSEAAKGNQKWLGRHHTEDSKKKMSEARKGKAPPNKGCKMSEQQKESLRKSSSKRVKNTITGEIYESGKKASEAMGKERSYVSREINRYHSTEWKYVE